MFKKSKLKRKAKKALKLRKFFEAGRMYESIGDYKSALNTYAAGKEYNEMGQLYEKLGRESQAIEVYKWSGNIDGIIKFYLKRKDIEAACAILENNNRFQEAAEIYYNYEKYERAALIYEKKGFYKKAAYIYQKAGNLKKAAQNFEKWYLTNADTSVGYQNSDQMAEDLFKAVELYIKVGEVQKAYEMLLKNNKFEKAADLALKMEKLDQAAKLYEKAQLPLKAAEIYEKINQKSIACKLRGVDAFARGNTRDAAEWYLKGEDYTRAAELFEWEHIYDKAAYCCYMDQSYLPAAENYIMAGLEEEAGKMYELGWLWEEAADIAFKYKKFLKAGELYDKSGKYYKAGISFLKINEDKKAFTSFNKIEEEDEHFLEAVSKIATILLKNREPQLVILKLSKLLGNENFTKENLEWYYLLGQAHEATGNLRKAYDIYQGILTEDYSFKGVKERLEIIRKLIRKNKEKELISGHSSQRHKIIEKVGEGGMGVVYKAEDKSLKRIVALKVLDFTLIKSKRRLVRFYEEARSAASLSHPNIVTVFDVGQMGEDHFISMEFIDGVNLMRLIRLKKLFSLPEILIFSKKILEGLDYSHQKGVIHRDIKPHNIMVNNQNEIKILDFGIAVIRGKDDISESRMFTGTPYYMSPEQIQGIPVDHRTDIYSFGITLFHLLTGTVPFKGEDVFDKHLSKKTPNVNNFFNYIPHMLVMIVDKCMEKKRENRFQTASEILNILKTIPNDEKFERIEKGISPEVSGKTTSDFTKTAGRDSITEGRDQTTLDNDRGDLSMDGEMEKPFETF